MLRILTDLSEYKVGNFVEFARWDVQGQQVSFMSIFSCLYWHTHHLNLYCLSYNHVYSTSFFPCSYWHMEVEECMDAACTFGLDKIKWFLFQIIYVWNNENRILKHLIFSSFYCLEVNLFHYIICFIWIA